MRVCLMVEGQEGVVWDEWVALATACEDAGLEGFFCSDHLQALEEAGVQRVMPQLQDRTDTEVVALLGEVAAKVR